MNTEKLIQDYISGKISDEDQLKVEHLLKTDADFKEAFETHQDIQIAFQISEKDTLKKKFQEIEIDINKPSKFRLLRSNAVYLIIAASVFIIIFLNIFDQKSGNALYEENFSTLSNTYQPIVRSNATNENMAAFSAYENANYQLAQQEFELLLNRKKDPNIRFYYGLTFLNQAEYELALDQFKELEHINHDYKAEEYWYTALIYLKKEDFENAQKYLEKIDEIKSTFNLKQRKKLLEEFK
ncbi:hypothetical protein LX97_01336 [Nonlabens dokdonensis]|uniref:Uncharacterized protein n=2 Tax=Nonlabens dokdonensis TaxID=328515 RepID=L7WA06_NONDD|nr:hypothetical protein [Nonlabens dokdonensis]AGC76676.1 hypothetical protein DDD_1549 [Nonlabens dokdonensis DSW-6]PZX44325.1 hypothetical protein LX97_01336 [Nonlabens dokdonensis]